MSLIKAVVYIFILIFLQACSYRSSEFFEDIIAENKVIKADGRYKGKVKRDANAPIIEDKERLKEEELLKPIFSRGKIVSVNFDKDYNLYVYTFIDDITKKPITFYYDKNIPYGKNRSFKIEVRGNYLYKITTINENSGSKSTDTFSTSPNDKNYRIKHRKRRRSFIRTPIEEKINTL